MQRLKRAAVVWVSLGIAVAVALVRFAAPGPLELADMKVLDFRHTVRGPVAAGGAVVIVGVDEASLAEVGRWPWPRARLAALVDSLMASGAAVVGFDVLFSQPEEGLDPTELAGAVAANPREPAGALVARLREHGGDVRLADAFRRSGRVVLSHFFDFGAPPAADLEREVERTSELAVRTMKGATLADAPLLGHVKRAQVDIAYLTQAAAASGHINFLTDRDGIYRRAPLGIRVGERVSSAFPVEIARRYLGDAAATLTIAPKGVTALTIGARELPVDPAAQLWIGYLGPPNTVPQVAAAGVLAGRVPRAAIEGKIALVGFTAVGFDEIATPFAPVVPGVELQATVVDNILRGMSLRRPWWLEPAEALAIVLLGLVVGLGLWKLGAVAGMAAALALAIALGWGTQRLFSDLHLAIGGVYPLAALVFSALGASVYRWFGEEREKRKIRHAFRHYLNPEVTEMLAEAPERLRLGGERREITILFSDLRGFTTLSERLSPDALGKLLNEYLGAMTDIVLRGQGLLDKYMGDGLMAFWGAPVESPDGAARCCRAALDMVTALAALNRGWEQEGFAGLEMGVGINTGDAVIGNFGSTTRFNYTAVGDQVNLASRLEGLTKEYGATVIVAESTRQVLGDAFVWREIDRVRVKGREAAVVVYELLGITAEDAGGVLARRAVAYETALAAYRREDLDEAARVLDGLLSEHPGDRAAATFRARCARARADRAAARAEDTPGSAGVGGARRA
jgi:adenylate cyclase